MTSSPPSHDAASSGDLQGVMREILKKFLQANDDMLPAQVVSYDRGRNRAQVVPLIAVLMSNGETLPRPVIASVPVMQFGGGGFVLNFPLKKGDLGWIKANDRDISLFLQMYTVTQPNTERLHSFNDSVFIPDVMRGYTITGEDANSAVLQNLEGSVRVSLFPNKIKMTAPLVEIDGALRVTQQITSDTGVNVGPIQLTGHHHDSVQPGSGTSGGPVP